jgi:cell division ATPase FtsA
MQIDMKEAENLKVDFAVLTGQDAVKEDQLDIKFLEEIIEARYFEIFEKINDKLIDLGVDGRLPG